MLLIAATAFFVAAEFALVAIDRARLEALAASGSRRATVALGVVRRLSFHLSGAQLGVTLTSLILGFIAEPTLVRAIREPVTDLVGIGAGETTSVVIALSIATIGSMVLGELIPKGLVLARPVRATLYLAGPLRVFSLVFRPLIAAANAMANRIIRLFGVEPREELTSARSVEELRALVRTSGEGGTLDQEEVRLLTRSLRFAEKSAEDAMVPRRDVVSISRDATGGELIELSLRTGYSRFPVVGDDLDELVGIVPVKALFRIDPAVRATTPIASLVTPTLAVPETRRLAKLLDDLQSQATHMAVVVDEYGTSTGVVTVEDVLEEIVGEIADEYDPPRLSPSVVGPDGAVTLSGGLRPDEVFDATGFQFPDGPYATLAGFILDQLGHIPEVGASVDFGAWKLTVADVDHHRIAKVHVQHEEPVAVAEDEP